MQVSLFKQISFFLVLLVICINIGCSNTFYKKLHKSQRFEYWHNYNVYVDTSFVNEKHICLDGSPLDSNYIVQSLSSKKVIKSNRLIVERDIECLSEVVYRTRPLVSGELIIKCLVDQGGDIMAFKVEDSNIKKTDQIAACISNYKYSESVDSDCFSKVRISFKVDING